MSTRKKKIIWLFSMLLFFFLVGEIAARVFSLGYDFPYRKSSNDILMYEYIPNFSGKMWGIEFKTNSLGFRDVEYPIKKEAHHFRALEFGDSIAVGEGVLLENTHSKVLEKMLNESPPVQGYRAFEVLNMGVCAFNTIREVELLEKKGLSLDPDMVIVQYCLDDVMPSIVETLSETGTNQTWIRALNFLKDVAFTLRASRLIQFVSMKSFYYYYIMLEENRVEEMGGLANLLYSDHETYWSDTKEALARLAHIGKREEIQLLVVIFSRFESLDENYPYRKVHEKIRLACEQNDIPVLDLFEAYRGMNPEDLRLSQKKWDWWHPNERAHKIAAEEIYRFLALHKDRFFR